MSGVQSQVERVKALGFSGRDVRHIAVYVEPAITEIDNELVQTFSAYVGERNGNFFIDFPTDMIFVVMTQGWEFERFELDGKVWDGIAVMPEDTDFEVSFGDDGRQSVVVLDRCNEFSPIAIRSFCETRRRASASWLIPESRTRTASPSPRRSGRGV